MQSTDREAPNPPTTSPPTTSPPKACSPGTRLYGKGMLNDALLFALHRGALAKSPIAADEALARVDPLLRWIVRRRMRRLLRRAELETTRGNPGHSFRLAFLFGARRDVSLPDDEAAVAQAFTESDAPPELPQRLPWITVASALLCLFLAGGGWWLWHGLRPFSPRAAPAGVLLGVELPKLVLALGKGGDFEPFRRALLEPAPAVLGSEPARALEALVQSMEAVHLAPNDDAEQQVNVYRAAVSGFTRALDGAQLPYFVDGELLAGPQGLEPVLLSFYVQAEARVLGTSPSIRVVHLWRLDSMNVSQGYLGFTRPHTPAAIVLLDQIESHLVRFTLPAAARDGRFELVDKRTRDQGEPWAIEVEERASELARAYYQSLGEPLASEARHIGELLSERRELVRKWQVQLRTLGLELVVPRALFPKIQYEKQLALRVPRIDLRLWEDIHTELRSRIDAFERLRDRYAAGIERHEVQHRLDYARGLLPVPEYLGRLLRVEHPLGVPSTSPAGRARDEMSAYLAEMARTDDSPLLELLVLGHFVLDRDQGRTPYTYAAVAVHVALARELGMNVESTLGRGRVTRERFARLALAVWSRPAHEIQAAARRAYAAEFGMDLERVQLGERLVNQRYRP